MTVGRLKELIKDVPDGTLIFMKQNHATGNVTWLDQVKKDSYSTFGIEYKCLILTNEMIEPDIVDDEGEIKDLIELEGWILGRDE